MKIKELKSRSDKELESILRDSKEHLRLARFKVAQRELKDIRQVRELKKKIAQVNTILQQRSVNNQVSEN